MDAGLNPTVQVAFTGSSSAAAGVMSGAGGSSLLSEASVTCVAVTVVAMIVRSASATTAMSPSGDHPTAKGSSAKDFLSSGDIVGLGT